MDFEADEQDPKDRPVGQVAALELQLQEVEESIRKQAVENEYIPAAEITVPPQQDFRFCHHAGILLFSAYLNRFEAVLGGGADFIKQWIVTVLLGAVNIEQSKLLNGHDLQRLLGQATVNLNQQRQALGELALTDCLKQVLRINGECVGIDQCYDFYYDPHSKHYTGMHKTLKGWCSRLRFAEKILHMDFIHTSLGFPVYIHHDDNFYDLRERFIKVINAFRQQFGFEQQRSLTFVVDRGVYGMDFFENIIKDKSQTYFVTWEKGYQGDIEEPIDWTGCFHLYKERNSSKTLLQYTFSYHDQLWSRQNNMRRLIVRATNPKGKQIQVSILTNDLHRSAKELIELMFTRWIQENDFKYLDTHFGINEITSYGVTAYKDLEKVANDRQVKTGQYKALEKERTCIKGKLKTRLLRAHCSKKENPKREHEINELTQQLDAVEIELSQTDKEVSRFSSLVDDDFNKLDTIKKSLMDGIKITARNFFYLLLEPFKQAYDNYRDDHVLFRHLTRSSGLIRYQGSVVEVLLIPEADYPPKVAKIIDDMLAQLNANQMAVPDSSGGILHFRLARSESMRLTIRQTTREFDQV